MCSDTTWAACDVTALYLNVGSGPSVCRPLGGGAASSDVSYVVVGLRPARRSRGSTTAIQCV